MAYTHYCKRKEIDIFIQWLPKSSQEQPSSTTVIFCYHKLFCVQSIVGKWKEGFLFCFFPIIFLFFFFFSFYQYFFFNHILSHLSNFSPSFMATISFSFFPSPTHICLHWVHRQCQYKQATAWELLLSLSLFPTNWITISSRNLVWNSNTGLTQVLLQDIRCLPLKWKANICYLGYLFFFLLFLPPPILFSFFYFPFSFYFLFLLFLPISRTNQLVYAHTHTLLCLVE